MTQTKVKTQISSCFAVLSRKDKKYLFYIVGIQVCIGIFDLFSIALMGVVGALAISGVQSKAPTRHLSEILSILKVEDATFQIQIATLSLITASLLVIKTFFSLYFSRRVVFYLSARGAKVSADLIHRVAKLPLNEIKRFSEQSLLFSITSGVNVILIGVIAAICNLIADFSLLIMLAIALFFIDPIIAVLSILIFGSTALLLYFGTRKRALKYGKVNSEMNIASNTAVLNLFGLYRELTVRKRKSDYVKEIAKMRIQLAQAIAEVNFLPNLSKYIMEITLVLGGFLIVGATLLMQDAVNAAGALAVFLTAATRIMPALLRVQQSATGIRNALGMATPTLGILKEIEKMDLASDFKSSWEKNENNTFDPSLGVEFQNVSFKYFDSLKYAIQDLSLRINTNEMVAIVGPSGSGKSTFVDLLLGVINPQEGHILIGGSTSLTSAKENGLKIGYVPQDVSIIEGSLRENMIFGFPSDVFNDNQIWSALDAAELKTDLLSLNITLETQLGGGGQNLSGGQKQRLGIARALLENPQILVMDEATSALDSEIERNLNLTIQKMKGSLTLVVVAHRLSSVMNSDKLFYFDGGKLVAAGSFEEVRANVANFDVQAKLMGL